MEINKSIRNAFSCRWDNLGKLVFLERKKKKKLRKPSPSLLNPKLCFPGNWKGRVWDLMPRKNY